MWYTLMVFFLKRFIDGWIEKKIDLPCEQMMIGVKQLHRINELDNSLMKCAQRLDNLWTYCAQKLDNCRWKIFALELVNSN